MGRTKVRYDGALYVRKFLPDDVNCSRPSLTLTAARVRIVGWSGQPGVAPWILHKRWLRQSSQIGVKHMAKIVLAHGILGFGSIFPVHPIYYFNGIKTLYEQQGHEVICPEVPLLGSVVARSENYRLKSKRSGETVMTQSFYWHTAWVGSIAAICFRTTGRSLNECRD